jgi:mono/diheme cytochrome c family protein/uncharacterized membrane protein
MRRANLSRIGPVAIAACLVGSLAWAGHAVGTPGMEGTIHLAADIFHLLAVAAWVGALVPLALLLLAAGGESDATSLAVAQVAVRRFSTFGIAVVATILVTGIVNTWYLAGNVPALVGTDYGRLLLVKVALFLVMLSIAAVNRLWLMPRLLRGQSARDAMRQLGRNSAIEAMVGAVILVFVAVIGTLPPGLHDRPLWPFPVRVNDAVFGDPDLYAGILFGAACIAAGIFVRRFRWPAIAIGVGLYIVLGLRLPTSEAYPTTFYASPAGFSAQSVAAGKSLFVGHCATCHGPEGHGDGSAGAALKVKPADLTADHVYGHTDGDLFWWITHGIDTGMPEFGSVLDEEARWNLIEFIRATGDATRLRALSAGTTAAFPTPDFSVDCPNGLTASIDQFRSQIVHIVVAGSLSQEGLRPIADRDAAHKLRTIVVAARPDQTKSMSLCVTDRPEVIDMLALYRGDAGPLEGTEFLIDSAGDLRSMWRADDFPNGSGADALEYRLRGLRVAPRVRRPTGLQGHTHTH